MIDINCDMGEIPGQESIFPYITSANIACGGHAGDAESMRATAEQARRFGVATGAHPSYPDRANFGRIEMDLAADELASTVYAQVTALAEYAEIRHVKPHGALYNRAAQDAGVAAAIARGVGRFSREVILVGLARSVMLDVFADEGFTVWAEGFADRRYEADGSLRSRRFADALIEDPEEAAAQAARLAQEVQTICIHSDTHGAAAIAAAVYNRLQREIPDPSVSPSASRLSG